MVLDGESMPLDVGREKRLFDRYQKIAMDQKHKGCAASNCDWPPGYVEYHHPHPWHAGGRTDARTGIPLCPPHHHMAVDARSAIPWPDGPRARPCAA